MAKEEEKELLLDLKWARKHNEEKTIVVHRSLATYVMEKHDVFHGYQILLQLVVLHIYRLIEDFV